MRDWNYRHQTTGVENATMPPLWTMPIADDDDCRETLLQMTVNNFYVLLMRPEDSLYGEPSPSLTCSEICDFSD